MPRPTKQNPEKGDARSRLLVAAQDLIRQRGFAATSVDDLCQAAEVTKGAYFHHFKTKEALGVAAAKHWSEINTTFFADAAFRALDDPLDRVLAYIELRKSLIQGETSEFTCLAGTMTQEVYDTHPDIRAACSDSILGHAATLESDIAAAFSEQGLEDQTLPSSLARHIQAVIQGAFILAKATGEPAIGRDSLDHLRAYIELIFQQPSADEEPQV